MFCQSFRPNRLSSCIALTALLMGCAGDDSSSGISPLRNEREVAATTEDPMFELVDEDERLDAASVE